MDGDTADSLTSEDAAPAGVIDEAVATKEDGAALQSLLERTTALRGPDRDPKLCLLIAQVRFSAALFRCSLSRRVLATSSDLISDNGRCKIAASRFRPVI
jgi:hypothetical protein